MPASRPSRTVYLETFGCQMNELDSELVAGSLRALGYGFTDDADSADVVLYNTCSVREHAEQKVWSRLGELKAVKADRPSLVVGVLGCMAERDGIDLIRRMPVVDILCGPGELDKLPALLDNAVRTREALIAEEPTRATTCATTRGSARVVFPNRSPEHHPLKAAGDGTDSRATDCCSEQSVLHGTAPHPQRPLKAMVGGTSTISASQVALQGNASRRSATLAAAEDSLELLDLSRAISPIDPAGGPRRTAYVRITRGCNKFCTYCVVPFTRGAEVHRPPAHIIDECKKLADAGVIEVTLLGQTVNHYRFEHSAAVTVGGLVQPQKGRSYSGGHRRDPFAGEQTTTFADLLAEIHEKVPGISRLRFVTSYPRDFGDDVLQVIRDHPRICRYLHVPAQSGSDRMLKAMNRGYAVAEYEDFLARARTALDQPEIGRPLMVSSDFIVGFPGETDADFDATVALVERSGFKNSFIFKYSPRPGTTAYDKLPDDVPEDIKRRRNNFLLDVQTRLSDQVAQRQVGRTFDVFVEGLSRKEQKRRARPAGGAVELTVAGRSTSATAIEEPAAAAQLSGRTDGDLIVFFDEPAPGLAESLVGTIVPVRIERAERLSLFGRLST